MKMGQLAVIISNKGGDCYQVLLNQFQMNAVADLIQQMQDGKIKVSKEKLSLELSKSNREV